MTPSPTALARRQTQGETEMSDCMVTCCVCGHDVPLDDACIAYVSTMMALPSMQEWVAGAALEPDEIDLLEAEF